MPLTWRPTAKHHLLGGYKKYIEIEQLLKLQGNVSTAKQFFLFGCH